SAEEKAAWVKEETAKIEAYKRDVEEGQRCKLRLRYFAEYAADKDVRQKAAIDLLRALKTIEDQDFHVLAKYYLQAPFDRCEDFDDCRNFLGMLAGFAEVVPE